MGIATGTVKWMRLRFNTHLLNNGLNARGINNEFPAPVTSRSSSSSVQGSRGIQAVE